MKFIYKIPVWEAKNNKAIFSYQLEKDNQVFNFTESLIFPLFKPVSHIPQALLKNTLDNLSLVLGISYYKSYCPKQIILEGFELSKDQALFWNTLYTKGMGEFFYKNKIDSRGLISFPFTEQDGPSAISLPLRERSLVGIGGGKDSIVSSELLKSWNKPFSGFAVNNDTIKERVANLLGIDLIFVRREIDAKLLELNKKHDVYNGHVPVSAVYAFIGLLTALLYDYRYIIVSNEQSANYGNTTYLGEMINHQWSKSFEFEELFTEYVKKNITDDVIYFSLLRPMSEMEIAKHFACYPQYFSIFSSCNRNFKITEKTDKKWCADCSKCAFTFAILSAFIPKQKLIEIFGQNLFEKKDLLSIYKELLGVARIKPFDCVGTPEEVQVAFYLSSRRKEYENDTTMKFFQKEVLPKLKNIDTISKEVFNLSKIHRIPKKFQEALTI